MKIHLLVGKILTVDYKNHRTHANCSRQTHQGSTYMGQISLSTTRFTVLFAECRKKMLTVIFKMFSSFISRYDMIPQCVFISGEGKTGRSLMNPSCYVSCFTAKCSDIVKDRDRELHQLEAADSWPPSNVSTPWNNGFPPSHLSESADLKVEAEITVVPHFCMCHKLLFEL